MLILLHVNYPLFLSDFNAAWIFSTDSCKIPKYQILVRADFFHADRWADGRMDGRTDATKGLSQFCEKCLKTRSSFKSINMVMQEIRSVGSYRDQTCLWCHSMSPLWSGTKTRTWAVRHGASYAQQRQESALGWEMRLTVHRIGCDNSIDWIKMFWKRQWTEIYHP